ncbi:unnamed protein product [Macrosiphum euphorbiae]|uniref:CCHC-type domain-containing protein n=1 Tax=Macrosiphum euphorbiae TaxID=13131 RepID=A0AAV0X4T1_9HEMI|nr:unnamed protein product [Macrosiphum euphorbiae]
MDPTKPNSLDTSPSASQTNNTKTFAETTANIQFPKKDQAIVFNSIEDVPQIEYIKAFSQLTSPTNITFASRISNNRFCIYFTNKNIVEQIISQQSHIVINNSKITFRRLINPAKRIILSNVQPIIPHEAIKNAIANFSIKILSPITFMKAGFTDNEYGHIGSFRRQLYINPDDNDKLPSSILIEFEQTEYRIFLSDDTVICYLCKQTGHTSNRCKNAIENKITDSQQSHQNSIPSVNDTESNTQQHDFEHQSNSTSNSPFSSQEQVEQVKRPAPSSSSSILNMDNDLTTENPINLSQTKSITQNVIINKSSLVTKLKESQSKERKANNPPTTHPTTPKTNDSNPKANKPTQPLTKKPKRSNSIEQIILKLDESLASAKLEFEKMPNRKIDFNQLKYIIENTLSTQDPSSVLKEFNISWMEMIEILDTIRPKVKNLSIKNRLSRLSNSLLDITLGNNPTTEQL